MNAGPVPEVQGAPPAPYPGVGAPGPIFFHQGQVPMGVPDNRERKLAFQPIDGKEIYRGLGSGILEWGKEFVRQVSFSERACNLFGLKTSTLMYLVNTLQERHKIITAGRWRLGGLRVKPWSM